MQFSEEKPIWRQIYDHITMRILSGEWREDERIISVREMAASVGVNPNTVVRSYERLEADGIIYNRRGVGFFVSPGAQGHIKHLERKKFIDEELPRLKERLSHIGLTLEVRTEKEWRSGGLSAH
jgi:DNA-binding transcriptional regulator YhcF (GntR family)